MVSYLATKHKGIFKMAFSVETVGRLWASGRNYVNLGIGFASGIGILSAAQNKGITDALGQIYDGVAQVVTGATSLWQIVAVVLAPILGPILARIASNSAKTENQAAAVKAAIADPNTPVSVEAKAAVLDAAFNLPEVPLDQKLKVTDPVLAIKTSSDNVVSVK